MDLKALQETLRAFASERDWEQFHTPKNLAMALMVEAAGLMELFQWKTPEESYASKTDQSLQACIGEEAADVLLYLLQLVDHTGVDLEYAVHDKLLKNAKKHAVPDTQVVAEQQDLKLAQTHVLVDWENVQPKDLDIRALVPDVTHVWLFHGPTQKRVADNQQSFGNALTLIPITRSGKNALDFHLSYYVGYISSRNPNAKFLIVSNDQGYGPMLEHAQELGFSASQLGFVVPKTATKKAVVKKVAVKKPSVKKIDPVKKSVLINKAPAVKKATKAVKVTATKTSVVKKITSVPVKKTVSGKSKSQKPAKPPAVSAVINKPTPVVSKKLPVVDAEKIYSHVLASLRKSKNKPSRKARLFGAVKSLLGVEKVDDVRVERLVQRLIDDGHLVIDANGAVTKTP